ncbi:hypothetical protein L1049_022694 [Liquidambar formosana]|uniref:DUF8040 domain-containing protein n=1 Tax=Liquidambar formosana TaxID=63359 RepID=A0AAP0RDD0_LIQFO
MSPPIHDIIYRSLGALVLLLISQSSSGRNEVIKARRRSSRTPSTLLHDSLYSRIWSTFAKLCDLLRTIGKLKDTKHVTVEEMTTMFLHILAHHVKNRVIINKFMRSGETISRYFNLVLNGVIRLQSHLLKQPEAVSENSTDGRWKWFKNCFGALYGTYVSVTVPEVNKPRYRTRKNDIATNVLGVCSQDMQFIFVLPGGEGSVADS